MASEKCGALSGDKNAVTCALPVGHEGPHAPAPCDHRNEQGELLLIYMHQGARCVRCGAFVI